MKVVHIFWSLTYGGIETMLVNIANEQTQLGAEVHVVIINDCYEEKLINSFNDNVTVHLIKRKCKSKNMWFAVKMNRLLNCISPDAIHLHSSRLIDLICEKRLSRVASVTLHDLPTGLVRRYGILSRLFPIVDFKIKGNVASIDRVPRIFSISKAVKDDLLVKYGIESHVIYNGIKTKSFHRREAKMFDGKLRIVQVSRLEHDKKGQDLLIEAVGKIRDKVMVDFIGDGSSNNFLKNLVKGKGMESLVNFLGAKSQAYIAEHLANYDLFIQPSRYEGFGLTVAEAMAANVPVLVSGSQGPAEVTSGDKFGWTFENDNADDLRNIIEHIINHYNEALEKSKEAMKYVCDNFDVSRTAKEYLKHYR